MRCRCSLVCSVKARLGLTSYCVINRNRLCGVSHAAQKTNIFTVCEQKFSLSGFRGTLFTRCFTAKLRVCAMCGIRCDMAVDGGDVMVIPTMLCVDDHGVDVLRTYGSVI